MLEHSLPAYLVENRATYSVMSAGVHNLTAGKGDG